MKDHIFELQRKISAFFIIYGHITNLQSDQLSVGLVDQLVEHWLHRYCSGHRFESCSGLIFLFQALISQLLKLCV